MATNSVWPINQIFTPTGFPIHTYVDRDDAGVERSIQNAFETPGTVISISGPSKSGKTVLVKKIVGDDNLIQISGGSIDSPDQLWDDVLARLAVPAETTTTHSLANNNDKKGGVTLGMKGVASVDLSLGHSRTGSRSISQKFITSKLDSVVSMLMESTKVIFIDDFHYMNRALQNRIARQIKSAAENSVHFCIASVPHRSDDVVRSNPELRGRTVNIDTEFWDIDELKRIGSIGFPKTGLSVTDVDISRLAAEACNSPQLMQALCLEFGRSIQVNTTVDEDLYHKVLSETAKRTDYTSLVRAMHQGPRLRRERNQFDFIDGSFGDVYRAVLLAISKGEPNLTWNYIDLRQAISNVCVSQRPTGSSFVDACKAISNIARDNAPQQRIIEWDSTNNGTLSIVDPYFLFFIRQSILINKIGRRQSSYGK
jgi:nucleoside-triphosphatase THEP1